MEAPQQCAQMCVRPCSVCKRTATWAAHSHMHTSTRGTTFIVTCNARNLARIHHADHPIWPTPAKPYTRVHTLALEAFPTQRRHSPRTYQPLCKTEPHTWPIPCAQHSAPRPKPEANGMGDMWPHDNRVVIAEKTQLSVIRVPQHNGLCTTLPMASVFGAIIVSAPPTNAHPPRMPCTTPFLSNMSDQYRDQSKHRGYCSNHNASYILVTIGVTLFYHRDGHTKTLAW